MTNGTSNIGKIAKDLFFIQIKWALWFIPIVFAVYLIVPHFVKDVAELNLHFLSFIYQPTKIFMLVIGIITSLYYLPYFVSNGITRKDYFYGAAIGSATVAFGIMFLSAILAGILELIGAFSNYQPSTSTMEFLQSTSSIWIIPILVYSFISIGYYISGWMIALGFYRFGGWGGMGFILVAILYINLTDLIWEGHASHPFGWLNIPFPDLPLPVSLIGALIFILLGFMVIRKVSKRITIAME
ncbi:hypothetical protein [Evansella tamaricis]|uniref:Uncharacterized protein n=1 Tax=Evansella tamaricis TaxID=2069301 RepID=A0ABS6JDC4_9BACI|nr:hypothetical protein [Evansella tamaricis]MBU9711651.1 hypothetical protein [Evansella tamaricis]